MHFVKVDRIPRFAAKEEYRQYSTDWALSAIFDEIQFVKTESKTFVVPEQEDCGNQVEEKQIF